MKDFEKELFELLLKEAKRPFLGWDFSYLSRTGRWATAPLPWSYASTILPYMRKSSSLLDMGTGGGEFLSLLQPLPPHTSATESYPPNIPIAQERLEPLGVTVVAITQDEKLPFNDDEFELIINRHESYAPSEVQRILNPGGYFITQQVGEKNDIEINQILGSKLTKDEKSWTAQSAAHELKMAGFHIVTTKEAFPITRFYDIGAIVYYLKAIPWVVSDFAIEKYKDALFRLHQRIQKDSYLDIREHRFLIISQKNDILP